MSNTVSISLITVIQRNEKKFLANKLGEELVMMNLESGDFVSLNNVGADIWELTAQPVSIKNLLQQLQDMYDITEEQCRKETIQFLLGTIGQAMFVLLNTDNR